MGTQSIHPCTGSREGFTQPDGVALRVKGWFVTSHIASETWATGITGQDPLQVAVVPVQLPSLQCSAEHCTTGAGGCHLFLFIL